MKPLDYFLNAVKNKYAEFNGRARRSEYWYFTLFNMIGGIIIGIIAGALQTMVGFGGFLSTIYSLALLIPGIAVGVRRMHDVGKSGWFLLIPFYNLYLLVTDSEGGANQYGPNPKTGDLETVDHLVD